MLDKKGTTLEHIILLRGVTPNGKNAIPKMSYLVDILIEADFQHVRTYIQSGNIILESDLSLEEIREQVHTLIKEKIGADLKMVIKNKNNFAKIVQENPFGKHYLYIPRTAKRKKLNTNYLEKLFGVDLTMRKLNVVEKLLTK